MELSFIWVEDYKIIRDTGFNFSNSTGVHFFYDGKTLKVKTLPKPILDFGPKILSVTAIAGQNGSGKSTLCEVIIRSIATLVNGSMGYSLLFKGIICIGKFVFIQESLTVNNQEELTELGFMLRTFKDSPLEELNGVAKIELLDLGFIYYSNVLDWRSGYDEMNLANISTLNLVYDDVYYSPYYYFTTRHDHLSESHYQYYHQKSPIQVLHLQENHRFVKFILKNDTFLPFDGPQSFDISISNSSENRWLDMYMQPPEVSSLYTEVDRLIRDSIYRETSSTDKSALHVLPREQAIQCIHNLYRFNIAQFLAIDRALRLDSKSLYGFVFQESMPEQYSDYEEQILTLINSLKRLVENATISLEFKPESMGVFHPRSDWRLELIQQFNIVNTEGNRDLLKTFLENEESFIRREDKSLRRLTSCSILPALSAGENSFLTLFARLYDTILRYTEGYDVRKNLIVFIDEGDMAFHPDWKKRLLLWLKNFLNEEFQPFQVQLFLTSHSPYLLSDLNSENVILLRRESKGKTQIVDSSSYRTFSANIHELLADSFYMQDGFIGEYAKKLLENMILFLQSRETQSQQWNKERARQIIKIVADDIIRTRLEDLYEEKFGEPIISLGEEKEQLEARLREINKAIKNDSSR